MRALASSAGGRRPGRRRSGVTGSSSSSSIEASYWRPQKPLVPERHAAGIGAGRLQGAVALLSGLRADQLVADRHAHRVGDQDQPHAPDELALRRAAALAGGAGEVALGRAAGGSWRSRSSSPRRAAPGPRRSARRPSADSRELGSQPPQAAVELRLVRQPREVAGQEPADRTEEPALRAEPSGRLRHRERDQLLVGDLPHRPRARNPHEARKHLGCDNNGLQRPHPEPQPRLCRAGGPFLRQPAPSSPNGQPTSSP
jgi:hypothetical protein